MRIKFYLKRPAASTETTIFALINYSGNKLKIYTGEAILPKFWNPETNSARNTPKFTEHATFNERLNKIKSTISQTFLDFKNKHANAAPSPAILRPLIEIALKKGEEKITFLNYFEDFVKRAFNGQRLNPRTKKPIRGESGKSYQTTLNHLKNFNKTWKRKLDFETIDLEFHADYTNFLSSPPLLHSANTIGSHIKKIKAVMAEATEKGINSNSTYKSKYFVKQSEESDSIYLNEEELKEIRDFDLSNNPRLDNVRDLFLIGCYTALRFSDLKELKDENISDGMIRITQIKTGDPVSIPIHPYVKGILKKYSGHAPRSISLQKMNAYLKDLGALMESLKKTEKKEITKGGVKMIININKWKLLSTHTMRRTLATNEYNKGKLKTLQIMSITGHKTERAFLKYIKVTPAEHALEIKLIWDKEENQLKAV